MSPQSRIYIAGHQGLVGSAIVRALLAHGHSPQSLVLKNREELDLTRQADVEAFFKKERPEYVFLAAAKVGGILANSSYSADFIRDNILIQNNVIDAAYRSGVKKLLFMGSSCIYPKHAPQPMKEEYLLTGPLEPTNEWYAIAKIAGIKMCQAYRRQYGFNAISIMPTNLYGPGDNFDLETSHVLPALIRKFHEAKERKVRREVSGDRNNTSHDGSPVTIWGTGTPRREFLHVDDMADATLFLMENYNSEEIVNVGMGEDISIGELTKLVKDVVGYEGEIVLDRSKPDGTPRKQLDVSRINSIGWKAKIDLREGITETYKWYLSHTDTIK
ncbi:MAG: GDP-L-fucose synthase [bacterium]|nr:GDP-L-fucose synthase [bacterium]